MPYDTAGVRARLNKGMKMPKPGSGRTADIELPNESGLVDPRVVEAQQRTATRKEQPRGVQSNLQLRRSMLGGSR